jgi:hypothetical protein
MAELWHGQRPDQAGLLEVQPHRQDHRFLYIRLQSELSEHLSLDNRAYMYGYTNNTLSGTPAALSPAFRRGHGGLAL